MAAVSSAPARAQRLPSLLPLVAYSLNPSLLSFSGFLLGA